MEIYSLIKKDHQKINKLFLKLVKTSSTDKVNELFLKIKKELALHLDPEHDTFYKALKKYAGAKGEIIQSDEEHDEIKKALKKITSLSKGTTEWFLTLGELKQLIARHVAEEESVTFKLGKKYLSKKQATQLAKDMHAIQQRILEKMQPEGFIAAISRMFTGSEKAAKRKRTIGAKKIKRATRPASTISARKNGKRIRAR